MDNLTAGNPVAHAVRVYYFGTSTIYEGMPVCYDNSTTNWFGGSVADTGEVTVSLTTAEGSQNKGKYIRVENPNADNVSMFAGVVKRGGWVGQTGPKVLDIYVPNGAVVPVRTDSNCLIDQTILAVTTGSQELGVPLLSDSRPVAIARETVNRGTAGLVLAELCPYRFIFQDSGGTALSVDDADNANSIVNRINLSCLQTSGWCIAFSITQATVTTSNSSAIYFGLTNTGAGTGGFHVLQVRGSASGTAISGDVNGVYSQVDLEAGSDLTAGIATGIFSKVHVKAAPGGTHAGDVMAGHFGLGLDVAVAGDVAQLYFDATTVAAITPDYFFKASSDVAVAQNADGGTATGTTCGLYLKILVNATAYYIPTYTAAELAS